MPTANIWKGHLTFGLVSLPVKRSRAARGQTTHFHLLHAPDHSRIRQAIYCLAEGRPVPRDQLIKGYEYQKDRYVVMRDEELRQVAPQTAKVMELLEFVSMDEVDPVYLESSYYLAPDRGGNDPTPCYMKRCGRNTTTAWPRSRCTTANTSSSCGPARAVCCCTPCTIPMRSGRRTNSLPTAGWCKTRNWNWRVCSSAPEWPSSSQRSTTTRIAQTCRS